jgi:hypothetical protein
MNAKIQLDRRRFLRGAGATTAGVAAVAQIAPPTPAQAYDPGQDERRARYRESEDVKTFYRTNGYETLKK